MYLFTLPLTSQLNIAHHAVLLTDVTPIVTSEDDVVQYSDILPRKTLPFGATFVLSEEPIPPPLPTKSVLL